MRRIAVLAGISLLLACRTDSIQSPSFGKPSAGRELPPPGGAVTCASGGYSSTTAYSFESSCPELFDDQVVAGSVYANFPVPMSSGRDQKRLAVYEVRYLPDGSLSVRYVIDATLVQPDTGGRVLLTSDAWRKHLPELAISSFNVFDGGDADHVKPGHPDGGYAADNGAFPNPSDGEAALWLMEGVTSNPESRNQTPTASFSVASDVPVGSCRRLTFDASSSSAGPGEASQSLRYTWWFAGGTYPAADSSLRSTDPVTYHDYCAPGTYRVRLRVMDMIGDVDQGGVDAVTQFVVVGMMPPTGSISGPISLNQGESGQWTVAGSGGNGSYQYEWQRSDAGGAYYPVDYDATYDAVAGSASFALKVKVSSGGLVGWSSVHAVAVAPNAVLTASINGPAAVMRLSSATWQAAVTGGAAPYSYRWLRGTDTLGTSPSLTWSPDSSAQSFWLVLRVSDAQSGTARDSLWVVVNTIDLEFSSALGVVLPNKTCYDWTVQTTGGQAPFTYRWYRDSTLVETETRGDAFDHLILNTGTTHFQLRATVTDANGAFADTGYRWIKVRSIGLECPGGAGEVH